MQDGSAPTEPIAIERVCNGASRKETYTDFKGHFEFQFGQSTQARDATESGRDVFQNSGNRGPTQGMDSEFGIDPPPTMGSADAIRPELLGCELRASLPGFKSSTVMLRPNGSSWDLDVGTIVLTRLNNVSGATISVTTMAAPESAKRAYEKGEKLATAKKFGEAEKSLRQAVTLYPNFASAWFMLGEVHREQNKMPSAKDDYNKAVSADAQFVNPYFGLAVLAIHEKDWKSALTYTEEVAKLNPAAFPLSYMYNAAANYYTGNLDAAETSARKFQTFDTGYQHPESTLLLSNILLAKQDYRGAAQQLEEYLKLMPNAPNAAAVKDQIQQLNGMASQTKK